MTTLATVIEKFVRKAFDIRDGELRRALLMQGHIFLIISTLLIVKPAVNGLFLSKFGVEELPFAFILVAVAAAGISMLYSRLLSRHTLQKIMTDTLAYSVASLVLFGLFLRLNFFEGPVLYLFYIWVALFALLATSQFWVMANLVFNAREAKRLFGFIGAGAIAGGIVGGYLTSAMAQVMSAEYLPFVCAVLLSLCIPIVQSIWERDVASSHSQFQQQKSVEELTERPINLIRQSPHLTYVAGIVGVSVMVAKLVDYQFGGIASKLIPNADELTSFFGFWFSTFNLLSLLLQLFLTRRVVGTFGVGTSLFILPSLILLAALLLMFFPELLAAAIFLKMSDGSLKQSVNKAAMELIIMPLPTDIKTRTKTFIDVFVDSLATGIVGLVLIFVVKGLGMNTLGISFIIVGLILVWLFLAKNVQREYLNTFKVKINHSLGNEVKAEKPFDLSSESAIGGLTRVLGEGTVRQLIFVLGKIQELPNERFFEPVRRLLFHPSPEVRAAALSTLSFFRKNVPVEEVSPFLESPSEEVKVAAFEYLLRHDPIHRLERMENYLNDPDPHIQGAALVTLAKETRNNARLRRKFGLENRIASLLDGLSKIADSEKLRFQKTTALKAIGHTLLPNLHKRILPFFHDDDPMVVSTAIESAGQTLSPIFVGPLAQFLSDKKMREPASDAMARYGKGILPELRRFFDAPETNMEIIRQVPAVVKKIGSQTSVDFLFELLDNADMVVRQEALRGLNTLHNSHPHLKFKKRDIVRRILHETQLYQDTLSVLYAQMNIRQTTREKMDMENLTEDEAELREARRGLINLLENRLDRNLERIFRLLGLNYASEDILAIYRSLRSEKEDLRLNALEFLDNLLEPNLKKVIVPLIETTMLETITEDAIKTLELQVPDEADCFAKLLQGKDARIKLAVLYLIGQLGDPKYWPLVEECLRNGEGKVRDFAEGVLN